MPAGATLPSVSEDSPVRFDSRLYTAARLSLGRRSTFVSTREQLQFQLDHARARDAVHDQVDFLSLGSALSELGMPSILLESAVPSGAGARALYLRRPDLGRRLSSASAARLSQQAAAQPEKPEVALVIADGLSALAVDRHAVPLVQALRPCLDGWSQAPVSLVRNGRVAVGDQVGEMVGAELVILMIGERPGLTSPDSLGVYLTYHPRAGRTDADRNCISNIRPEGLGYEEAARLIWFYARSARTLGRSGFELKATGSSKLLQVR